MLSADAVLKPGERQRQTFHVGDVDGSVTRRSELSAAAKALEAASCMLEWTPTEALLLMMHGIMSQ